MIMTKGAKLQNYIWAGIFGSLGLGSFVGALFFGATHQFFMAAVSAVMVWALLAETKEKKPNPKR